jgi:prevent-host-death family protein
MHAIGAYEAKTHLPSLLDRVAKGERITITRHGVPVAVLMPSDPAAGRPASEVIDDLRRFRKKLRLKGLAIRDLIEEGRR